MDDAAQQRLAHLEATLHRLLAWLALEVGLELPPDLLAALEKNPRHESD